MLREELEPLGSYGWGGVIVPIVRGVEVFIVVAGIAKGQEGKNARNAKEQDKQNVHALSNNTKQENDNVFNQAKSYWCCNYHYRVI